MPTIADQLNELIHQKNELVANLNTMGVEASENEKLNTLVPKVLDIVTGDVLEKITVPTVSGSYTYNGSSQTVAFNNYSEEKILMTGESSAVNAGTYTVNFAPKYGYAWEDESYTSKSVSWTIAKANANLTVSKTSMSLTGSSPTGTFTVSTNSTATVNVSSSNTDVATVSKSGNTVTVTAIADGSATITVSVSETTNYKSDSKTVSVTASNMVHIYGVSWDGTSTTSWTRTDDAANFSDPVPYGLGLANPSSPFDELMPWAGMVKEERTGGTMVKIPKFWYKITQISNNGIKIQIADRATTGFNVSPAHMDRGDGKGERDYVYVGRYHCANSDYKSRSGEKPKANITRSTARTAIHNLGTNIWQSDFAMRFALWLLYIVEFADWNSQAKIGAGCGNNSSTENMGYTDSMPYHTGTTLSSRTSKGLGTQYRNIEGLWDNVLDWTDGAYYNNSGMNIILNPANFSDSAGGTLIGKPSNGYPSKFSVVSVDGTYQMFYPTEASGSATTYSCDGWHFNATNPCICVGGHYSHNDHYGMFYIYCGTSAYSDGGIGSRIMELP